MSIETMLFDQDYVTEMYKHELFEEGKKEGIQQGMQQGMQQGAIDILNKLVKQGLLTKEIAKKQMAKV